MLQPCSSPLHPCLKGEHLRKTIQAVDNVWRHDWEREPLPPRKNSVIGSLGSLAADAAVAAGASRADAGEAGYPDAALDELQSAEVRRYTTGTRVRFHGLQTQTALNGCVGHVLQFDRASGRVCVEKDVASKGESPSIRIKPKNLETIEPMSRDLNEVKRLVEEAYRRGDGARVALPKGDYLIPPDPTASALDQSLNAICNSRSLSSRA